MLVKIIDIIFPLLDGNSLLDSNTAWGQIALRSARPITDQTPSCALSDHITSSKILPIDLYSDKQ